MSSEKEVSTFPSKSLINIEYQPILKNIDYLLKKLTIAELKPFFSVLCDVSGLEAKTESRMILLFEAMARYWIEAQNNNKLKETDFKSFLQNTSLEELIEWHNKKNDCFISYDIIARYLLIVPKLLTSEIEKNKPDETSKSSHRIDVSRILLLLNDISEKILNHEKMINFLNGMQNQTINDKSSEKASIVHLLNHIKYDGALSNEKQLELYALLEGDKADFYKKNELKDNINIHLVKKQKNKLFNSIEEYIRFVFKKSSSELSLDEKVTVFNHEMFDDMEQKRLIELMLIFYDDDIYKELINRYDWPLNMPIANQIKVNEDGEVIHKTVYTLPYLYAIEHNLSCSKELSMHTNILEEINIQLNIENEIKNYRYSFHQNFPSNSSELHLIQMIEHNIIHENMSFIKNIENDNVTHQLSMFEFLLDRMYVTAFNCLAEKTKEKNNQFNINTVLKDYIKKNTSISRSSLLEKESLSIDDLLELKEVIQHHSDDLTAMRLLIKFKEIVPDNFINKPIEVFHEKMKSNDEISWYDKLNVFKMLKEADNSKTKILTRMLEEKQISKKQIRLENEDFFDTLEKKMPNFKEIIAYYKGQFRQNYYGNKKRINPILLLGDPGIGKTYFSKQLAKELNTGYEFIDMGSLSAGWVLTGTDGTWQDAKQGRILNAMLDSETFNPIVLLDEIDKTNEGKYSALNPLYQLLEEVNAKEFTDEYINVKFDASGIIYIACANNIQTLPEPLLSRFKIFNVPSPTNEQLHSILINIYQEAIEGNPILDKTLNNEVVDFLKTNSLREAKVLIEEAVSNALLTYGRNELDYMVVNKQTISLIPEHFKSKIKKKEFGFNKNN